MFRRSNIMTFSEIRNISEMLKEMSGLQAFPGGERIK